MKQPLGPVGNIFKTYVESLIKSTGTHVCLTRAVTSLTVVHAEPLPEALR